MILFWIGFVVLLVFSVVVHEVAHGVVAGLFGDPTAKRLGRLTLNPLVHLDLVGSVILPITFILIQSPVWLAWAKPVPVNTRYFQNPQSAMMWVALAGPLSNISLAFLGGLVLKIIGIGLGFPAWVHTLGIQFIVLNVNLAIFNLLPIPPLDGSRILMRFLSSSGQQWLYRVEPYGIGILLLLSFLNVLTPIISAVNRVVVPWFVYGI